MSHCEIYRKSFKHISIWSSPEPAIVIYPVSSIYIFNKGSDFDKAFNPFFNFGKSAAFLHLTATLYTGETEYFIDLSGCESLISILPSVPVLIK
jgi:hypothetical protein